MDGASNFVAGASFLKNCSRLLILRAAIDSLCGVLDVLTLLDRFVRGEAVTVLSSGPLGAPQKLP